MKISAAGQVGTLNLLNAPVSPDAAALGKFVEVPIGYYSGLPSIGIPLYSFNVKGVTVPLTLSYDASGIKVKNIPGQMGTGWAINTGGIITRVVRGYPDDHDPYVIPVDTDDYNDSLNRRKVKIASSIGNGVGMEGAFDSWEWYNLLYSSTGVTAEIEYNLDLQSYYNYTKDRMDTEIDLYYFNFLGNSGQFTFTNEGEPMLLSGTNGLKIEYTNRRYKITDAVGIEYYFDSTEQARDETSDAWSWVDGGRMYTTSWYLSKIYIPVHKQTISYSYRRFENFHLYRKNLGYEYAQAFQSRVDRLRRFESTTRNFLGFFIPSSCPPYDRVYPSSAPHEFANTLFISEINWNNNKIIFYGDTTRTDLIKYKLDSIEVISNNHPISKIKFDYSYFNAAASDAAARRLKLTNVHINDQHYHLKYIDSLHGRGMPPITATGQDIWGYYNGEDDESTISYYKLFDNWPDPNLFYYIQGANSTSKNSDYKYAQLGTLSSITYPTGGKTSFTYEGNDYSKVGFLDIDSTIESDEYTQIKLDSLIGKETLAYTDPQSSGISANNEREFVVHKDQVGTVNLSLGLRTHDISYNTYLDSIHVYWFTQAQASIKKYNDITRQFEAIKTFRVKPIDSIGNPPTEWDYDQVKQKAMNNSTDTVYLPEGRYRISAEVAGWYMSANIVVSVIFPYKREPGIYQAGGLRIKKIQFISNTDADTSFVKTYEYKTDSLSSGVLESPFANIATSFFGGGLHTNYVDGWGTQKLQQTCGYVELQSEPVIPLGNAQGGVIGYAFVKEILEDNSATGYHYTNGTYGRTSFGDVFLSSTVVPTRTRVLVDNSWKRGLLKRIDYFNSHQELVRQAFTDYIFEDNQLYQQSISMVLDDVILYPAGWTGPLFAGYTKNEHYYMRVNRYSLKKLDSIISFTPAGNISEVTRYTYKNQAWPHVWPISISHKSSLGEQTITHFKYPQDYTYLGAFPSHAKAKSIKNLLNKHVVAPAIETYVEKKDANGSNLRTISGQFVSYNINLPLPDSVFALQTREGISTYQAVKIDSVNFVRDIHYKPVVQFPKYDSYGNIAEQSKNKDVRETIVWGYNHQFPVVRVLGADYNSVINLVDTAIINSPSNDFQLLSELNKIRTHFQDSSGVMVSTYAFAELKGMTAQVDPAGQRTIFIYNEQGRLALVFDHNGKIIRKICYNYHGQPESCQIEVFGNAQVQRTFSRKTCSLDSIGVDTSYVVTANRYFGASQAMADSLAMQDIYQNGQLFANQYGRCEVASIAVLVEFESGAGFGEYYTSLEGAPLPGQALILYEEPSGMFVAPALSLNPSKTYVVTYWTDGDAFELMDNTSQLSLSTNVIGTHGAWHKYESTFTGASGNLWFLFTNSGYLMDFRIREL